MKSNHYPEECVRGVSSQDYLNENNTAISVLAFQFREEHCNDGEWIKESINWKDDENAISFTLAQKKKDTDRFQFVAIASILRDELDNIRKKSPYSDFFNYERDPEKNENEYHGNLLLKKNASKILKFNIRHVLAFHCKDIIMREDR